MTTHVIFNLIGNDLKSQVMTYLWFGIRMKHLPVWDLYTLSGFPLFSIGPSVSSKCSFRNKMLISRISFVATGNSINMLSSPKSHIIFFLQKICVALTGLEVCFFAKRVHVLVEGFIETIAVSLCYPETIKSDGTQRHIWSFSPFVEDSMSFDRDYCSLPSSSRDNQVRWHADVPSFSPNS